MRLTMKALKIIAIISFFLIGGVNEKGTLNFMIIPMGIFVFFSEVFDGNIELESLLGFLMILVLVGTLLVFYRSRKYKDRYIMILCFISLSLFSTYLSGIIYHPPTLWFIVTSGIFIIASLTLIVWNFKPLKINQN